MTGARASLVDGVLRRKVDDQRHGVGLDAERGEALPVAVVDRDRDGAVEEVALVPAAGRRLQVGGEVADRPRRRRGLAEAAGDVRQVDDERDVGHAVVRRVQRLDGHRVGPPVGDHLVDEVGDGVRAPGAHKWDRRDQPPAGGQAAPRRRAGCARRRHPHVLADLPQQAEIRVRRSRPDHGDLVLQRRRTQQRERSRVRAGERRMGQIGKDEQDAHGCRMIPPSGATPRT